MADVRTKMLEGRWGYRRIFRNSSISTTSILGNGVCVQNDVHHCLYGVRMCSFFHSSMTPSLSIPSSQRRSMASSACLAKYWPSIRRMSRISASEVTLEISSNISIWNGVNGVDCTVAASIIIILFNYGSKDRYYFLEMQTFRAKKQRLRRCIMRKVFFHCTQLGF